MWPLEHSFAVYAQEHKSECDVQICKYAEFSVNIATR